MSEWLSKTQQQIESFRHLKAGWDTYDAAPIEPGAIALAQEMFIWLRDWNWQAVPVADGGVQLECQHNGYVVEVYIRKWEEP